MALDEPGNSRQADRVALRRRLSMDSTLNVDWQIEDEEEPSP